MSQVLVNGSIAYDLLLYYDGNFADAFKDADLDKLSAAFVTSHFAKHHGGTAANIAWGLNMLGGKPVMVGTVGRDGGDYLALLEDRGISTAHIESLEDDYCSTAIMGSDSGERQMIFFHPGADGIGSWPDLNEVQDDISYAISSPRNDKLMAEGVDWASKNGVPVLFDPGQQVHAFGDDQLRRTIQTATGLICNAYEWNVVSSRLNLSPEEALESVEYLIITQGEDGLVIHTKDGQLQVGACPVEAVVNPTGAGDALRAGLLHGFNQGWSMQDSARLGAAMGAYAVECEGTLMDGTDKEMVYARAFETFGEQLPS